ncbi:MAG: hypothetical protein ACK4TA_15055 [Saprospiraceae bacterium]
MNFVELETQIEHFVAMDEIESAIKLLLAHFHDHERLGEVILLSGIYHSLLKNTANGVVEFEEVQRTLNQLRISILNFIKLEAKAREMPLPVQQTTEDYLLSLTRITILWLLKTEDLYEEPLNMTNIHKLSGIKNRRHIAVCLYEMENNKLVNKVKIGKLTCWKLTDKGMAIAHELEQSLLFRKE